MPQEVVIHAYLSTVAEHVINIVRCVQKGLQLMFLHNL